MAFLVGGRVEQLEGSQDFRAVLIQNVGDQNVQVLGDAGWRDLDAGQAGFAVLLLLLF